MKTLIFFFILITNLVASEPNQLKLQLELKGNELTIRTLNMSKSENLVLPKWTDKCYDEDFIVEQGKNKHVVFSKIKDKHLGAFFEPEKLNVKPWSFHQFTTSVRELVIPDFFDIDTNKKFTITCRMRDPNKPRDLSKPDKEADYVYSNAVVFDPTKNTKDKKN